MSLELLFLKSFNFEDTKVWKKGVKRDGFLTPRGLKGGGERVVMGSLTGSFS